MAAAGKRADVDKKRPTVLLPSEERWRRSERKRIIIVVVNSAEVQEMGVDLKSPFCVRVVDCADTNTVVERLSRLIKKNTNQRTNKRRGKRSWKKKGSKKGKAA